MGEALSYDIESVTGPWIAESLAYGYLTDQELNGMKLTCLVDRQYGTRTLATVCITRRNVLALVTGVINFEAFRLASLSTKIPRAIFAIPGPVHPWHTFVGFGAGFQPPGFAL